MTVTASLGGLPARASVTAPVDVYTTTFDPRGLLIRFTLLRLGVAYRCVDVVANLEAASALARQHRHGRDRIPVVSVDGEWLLTPTQDELRDALWRHHCM